MATSLYLAMTAAEYYAAPSLPPQIAWMACHFSPYGSGLSNVPEALPPQSLLILSDIIPIRGHDPQVIAGQLEECIRTQGCSGLLLDFQRHPCSETAALTDVLTQVISCPVAVSEPFALGRNCPVFLPPCPPHIPLKEFIAPWEAQEVWLETACSPTQLSLTASGAMVSPLSGCIPDGSVFSDKQLNCHYLTQLTGEQAIFQLWRNTADLEALLEEGSGLGITRFVGLYQELHSFTQ